jgi:hypothetical protein
MNGTRTWQGWPFALWRMGVAFGRLERFIGALALSGVFRLRGLRFIVPSHVLMREVTTNIRGIGQHCPRRVEVLIKRLSRKRSKTMEVSIFPELSDGNMETIAGVKDHAFAVFIHLPWLLIAAMKCQSKR